MLSRKSSPRCWRASLLKDVIRLRSFLRLFANSSFCAVEGLRPSFRTWSRSSNLTSELAQKHYICKELTVILLPWCPLRSKRLALFDPPWSILSQITKVQFLVEWELKYIMDLKLSDVKQVLTFLDDWFHIVHGGNIFLSVCLGHLYLAGPLFNQLCRTRLCQHCKVLWDFCFFSNGTLILLAYGCGYGFLVR